MSGMGDWVKWMGIDNTGPGSGLPMMLGTGAGYVPCGLPFDVGEAKPGAFVELLIAQNPNGVPPPPRSAQLNDVLDVCPTCGAGRVEKGVASLPNECCAIYFFGRGSFAHGAWKAYGRPARYDGHRLAPEPEDEAALRKRLTGLGRDALVEEIVRLRCGAAR